MDLKVEVKEEPVWLEGEASSSFDNYELISEEMNLKEEIKSELAKPGQTQHFVDVKNEIFLEEHTFDQLAPCFKEEDNAQNVAVLTRGPVDTFPSSCEVLKTGSELMCTVSSQHLLSQSGERSCHHTESNTTLSPKTNDVRLTPTCRELPHVCYECGKRYSVKGSLKRHMLTHNGERPHCCNICGRRFMIREHLRAHVVTHSGERPYCCKECGKAFTVRASLSKHMLIHTGVRPYCCNTCGKGFIEKCKIREHMLTHTGERPHICNICGKRFKLKGHLSRHQLNHLY